MLRLRHHIPVEPAGLKSRGSVWVGNLLACGFVIEPGKARKLLSPARRYCRGQVFSEIAEKQKRCFRRELLTHEEQWRRGREQHDLQRGANRASICNHGDPFAERAVSDLIMILQE